MILFALKKEREGLANGHAALNDNLYILITYDKTSVCDEGFNARYKQRWLASLKPRPACYTLRNGNLNQTFQGFIWVYPGFIWVFLFKSTILYILHPINVMAL